MPTLLCGPWRRSGYDQLEDRPAPGNGQPEPSGLAKACEAGSAERVSCNSPT